MVEWGGYLLCQKPSVIDRATHCNKNSIQVGAIANSLDGKTKWLLLIFDKYCSWNDEHRC